ncbi:light-harvesting complex-like protein OHP2, chloroplastic isoform X2 [Vigna radiata var. radiata]|uniref:Light-harvesting complex-like protein OHP2, chloroplastic isoform X2 n=1 Tax=Vigna radiata var. radiata TaxID=3916 RepID=A0A1S3V7U9_VIGRR|nr:light-harvesting complex-like protein OHP2, chloroplastic isoform X2 [Vigna radiata var. radiata]
MSVTSSFPCIKIPACSSSPTCTSSSNSSFRFSSSKPYASITVRNSQTEGPLRRPVSPPVREPSSTIPQPLKPSPPSQPPLQNPAPVVGDDTNVITLEFQRQKAKELQEYFKKKKLEEADQGPFFGFIGKNEISNGRLDSDHIYVIFPY